ncbi:MAG TPA: FHA domain-containing protein [Acidimicrobiales bacterium]|nr:FHA domain-containing protein [Acidimicrobiales bacterium]
MATTTKCPTCGADSTTSDYCDTCGAPLAAAAAASPAAPAPVAGDPAAAAAPAAVCPNCGAARSPDDAFCEGCGLDFATGQMPVAPTPAAPAPGGIPSGWTAVVEADRAFFDSNEAEGATAIAFPDALAPREVPLTGDEVVIGRRSEAKGFFPGIDLSSPVADPGVSHRHAALRRQADGSWALVDEMSTNGTWLNGSDKPVDHGVVTALRDGDRINVGSFTRITIVKAP